MKDHSRLWVKRGFCLVLAAALTAGTALSASASVRTSDVSVSVQEDTADGTDADDAANDGQEAENTENTGETTGDSSADTEDSADTTDTSDTESGTVVKNGLYKENGSYYFYKNGKLVRNAFRTVNKKTYYFGKSGKNVTGLKKINGKYYYFKDNGVMVKKAFRKVKGKTYYFAKSGKNVTGFKKINGKRYYFKKNGVMLTKSFQKINGKKYYFTKSGAMATGITKIKGKYYYYSAKGQRMTGFFQDGNGYYMTNYANSKQNLVAYRKGKHYYYANGKTMSSGDKLEFYTMIRAYKILQKITTDSMSMSQKRMKAFKWVMNQTYVNHRSWDYDREVWPAVYALDHYDNIGGDCHADASAFAYLAVVIGYKDVWVYADGKYTHNSHCWCVIDGKVYDPLFAEYKSFSAYYGSKALNMPVMYAVPQLSASHASDSSDTSDSSTGSETTVKNKGIVYKNGKFYAYTNNGKLKKKLTKKIRKAAKKGTDIDQLISLIGKPNKSTYSDSCLQAGAKDGILKYDNFKVFTLKTDDGETYVSAEAK